MTSINTNLSSLIVQKNLTKSTNALNQAVERLTTGFKINHASDNAANYSISESMSSKLSSYFVAEENTSMGLDLIRTQSSTLDTIQNLTTRLRALAEQAHNGTYGAQSLAAINQEADAIISEIERIGNNAEYNGIKLFDNALSQAGSIPQLKSNGLMQEIERRDTSGMTRLADVDINDYIAAGTYSISSAEELAKLATIVNTGDTVENCEFVLGADIDLSAYSEGEGWDAIGKLHLFSGIFDGNGYTISGLYINAEEDYGQHVGLFGQVEAATIKNVILADCDVTSNRTSTTHTGGLVADMRGTAVINCSVTGSVKSENGNAGLLSAYLTTNSNNAAIIDSCYTSGLVNADSNAGGILGQSSATSIATLKDSYSEANVVSKSGTAGGLVGYARNIDIIKSGASGNIQTLAARSSAGGLVGSMEAAALSVKIENSAYTGTCVYSRKYNGAIVGNLLAEISSHIDISAVYDSSLSGDIPVIGRNLDPENTNISIKDLSSQLQVGIDSAESSNIKFTTNMSLSTINSLRGGMESAKSLERIDSFISKLSEAQTKLGSIENRLTSTIESIGVNIENLTSSRSTLKDADVAKESSQLLKNQILQQAAATLLSTANQTPSLALRLLNGI